MLKTHPPYAPGFRPQIVELVRASRTASTCARPGAAASTPGSSRDGQELRVRVDGQLTFNTSFTQVEAAVAGYGIAYVSEALVERHVAEGRRRAMLEAWSPRFSGHHTKGLWH